MEKIFIMHIILSLDAWTALLNIFFNTQIMLDIIHQIRNPIKRIAIINLKLIDSYRKTFIQKGEK
ncbi:MAG: hypothetical protein J6D26_01000 [Clostridia bacterium]|nr:hypothetical protein [Clostridia bacterium]